MIYEFELDMLRHIVKSPELKVMIQDIEPNTFSTPDLQFTFSLIQNYVKKFYVTPKRVALKQFFETQLNKEAKQFEDSAVKTINDLIDNLYKPTESGQEILNEHIAEFAKRNIFKNLLIEFGTKANQLTDEDYLKALSKIQKIYSIGKDSENIAEGRYLFKDFSLDRPKGVDSTPFFLKGINDITAAKGFYTPQVVVFAAPPKGFKTGIMLSAAIHWATVCGKKVLYCDTENGIQPLFDRAYQAMTKSTFDELISGQNDQTLQNKTSLAMKMGGEIRFEYFAGSTLDDVEAKINELKDDDFIPEIIIYDYFDNFKSTDKNLKQEHLQIQDIYKHAIRLNVKYNTFCLSVTQVGRQALQKLFISGSDLAKDFGKAANAHALFAVCGVQYEEQNSIRHIIPLFQRQGTRHIVGKNEVFIKLNEERMSIEEMSVQESDNVRGLIGLLEHSSEGNDSLEEPPIDW